MSWDYDPYREVWVLEPDYNEIEANHKRYDELAARRKEKQAQKDARFDHLIKVVSNANRTELIKKHHYRHNEILRPEIYGRRTT